MSSEPVKNALEPEWEARFEPRSLGFRPGRGCHSKTARNKAIIAVAHTMIVIIWHALAEGVPYAELGAGFYTRHTNPQQETRSLIARFEARGHKITIEPAAA